MSKFRIKKKPSPVMEDDLQQQQQNQNNGDANITQVSQNSQVQKAQEELIKLQNAIDQLTAKHFEENRKYDEEMKKLTDQKMLLNKTINSSNESVNESVAYGKQAELGRLIEDSFSNIEDKLSYWPSKKDIENGFYNKISRSIISYMNTNGYSITDTIDHSNDIKEALGSYFKNSNINYSEKEIEMISSSLIDTIEKTENSFKWLIKNKE